ncbi:MAG TPA: DEAD/DEAH box helicase [Methanophagales archaeon]|nr:DEAD/DEAH box helicase [Methanophagales archaeon]
MMDFKELGIIEPILKSIEEEQFERPTEIQEKSISLILSGKDVIAEAATGSGKTLAFAADIIQKTKSGTGIRALVLTPTRELAQQVATALSDFSKYKPLRIVAVFGGVSINPQIGRLRTADVVIGTPGRILDHIGRGTLDLSKVNILVLDEADRMLDMGFILDVKKIIRECPRNRQTLLFSATISREIALLARKYMKEPISVSAEAYVDPKKLTQYYYDVPDNLKFSLLVHLLNHEEAELVMVFCNTRSNTDFVANNLKAVGISAMAIHGGLTQDKRDRTMKQFHAHDVRVLVCTDVAARGLDIPNVSHIYNYDIPMYSKDYIHRIGRTARAGKDGVAINILASRDYDSFRRVMKSNEVTITEEKLPDVKKVRIRRKTDPKTFRPGRRPHSS